MKNGFFNKVLTGIIALLFALVLAEAVVRLFVPVRNVGPSFTTYDPVYGKALKTNISVERVAPEFTMTFTTNSHGFRGPEIADLSQGSLLFLGDSFTMGYGVSDGEEFPAIVRKATATCNPPLNLEVVNAGMGNNGNGRVLKFLQPPWLISYFFF